MRGFACKFCYAFQSMARVKFSLKGRSKEESGHCSPELLRDITRLLLVYLILLSYIFWRKRSCTLKFGVALFLFHALTSFFFLLIIPAFITPVISTRASAPASSRGLLLLSQTGHTPREPDGRPERWQVWRSQLWNLLNFFFFFFTRESPICKHHDVEEIPHSCPPL